MDFVDLAMTDVGFHEHFFRDGGTGAGSSLRFI